MRKVFVNESILFIAGDGLALMRMNHLLASKPDIYFEWADNPPDLFRKSRCAQCVAILGRAAVPYRTAPEYFGTKIYVDARYILTVNNE